MTSNAIAQAQGQGGREEEEEEEEEERGEVCTFDWLVFACLLVPLSHPLSSFPLY